MHVLNSQDFIQESFYCLELPWKNNQRSISCIPEGIYPVEKHTAPKFGICFHVKEVPNRSEILIHSGNYHTDIKGCILPGLDLKDINKDFKLDVTNSKTALKKLLALLPQNFELQIKNIYP